MKQIHKIIISKTLGVFVIWTICVTAVDIANVDKNTIEGRDGMVSIGSTSHIEKTGSDETQ